MILQRRDREILRLCYEHQFLLSDQVSRFFFKRPGNTEAYRRVRELESVGLIQRVRIATWNSAQAIRLTRRGVAVVNEEPEFEIPQRRQLDLATLGHDISVLETRMLLTQYWEARWVPEAFLKASEDRRKPLPDGYLVFESGRRFAVEVENSLKGKSRYEELLKRWESGPAALVLYVATENRLLSPLREYLKLGPSHVGIALTSLEKLRQGPEPFWTPRGEFNFLAKRAF